MTRGLGEDGTELQQIYKGLVDTINYLFQISMVIRRPAQHDRLLGTKRVDSASFQIPSRLNLSKQPQHLKTLRQILASLRLFMPRPLQGRDGMTIPPPPKESAYEAPFECPYCHFIITVKT